MTTAQQVLDVARSCLGTVEARDGSTPFHRSYGLPFSQPWCAVFLWDVFRLAGAGSLLHPRTAYTPTLHGWFAARGQASTQPRVGSLVFFNWPGDGVNRIQHVGIVEAVEPGSVVTIEGNTAATSAGSQGNGGGVWRRRRARNSAIVGFGHPAYTTAAASAEEDDLTPEQDRMLREVHRELTLRLPNRRGPDGRHLPNGGADTTLGYSANADGMLFHLMARIDELTQLVRAAGADPAGIERAVAAALADGLTVTSTISPRT